MQLYNTAISWMPWVQMLLLGVLLLLCAIQPRTISLSWSAVSSPIQRRYAAGTNHPIVVVLRGMFQLGTIALSLAIAVTAFEGTTPTIEQYGWALGATAAVVLAKGVLDKWIQAVFKYSINEHTYYAYRGELWQLMSVVLWVMVLLSPWLNAYVVWITPIALWSVYYGVLWWKIMQAFGWDIQHIVYSLIYMVHAEILPLLVIVYIIQLNK